MFGVCWSCIVVVLCGVVVVPRAGYAAVCFLLEHCGYWAVWGARGPIVDPGCMLSLTAAVGTSGGRRKSKGGLDV